MFDRRNLRFLCTLAAFVTLLGCASTHSSVNHPPASPSTREFFLFPATFSGRDVRLVGLHLVAATVGAPLRFRTDDESVGNLVVFDGRGLSRKQRLVVGQRISIMIRCTEGNLDTGNLLLGIETGGSS